MLRLSNRDSVYAETRLRSWRRKLLKWLSSTASLAKAVMIATRKLPRNTTKKGGKTARGESLLPHLSGDAASGFVGMKTGRLCERGYVIYVGGDLTPEMLLTIFARTTLRPTTAEWRCSESPRLWRHCRLVGLEIFYPSPTSLMVCQFSR
jgi:hypothetical protein